MARAALLTAAPGIGKSRLRHEFLRRVERRSEPVTVLLGRGDMVSAARLYGIVRSALRRLCEISGSESLEAQQQLLAERIGRHLPGSEVDRVVVFLGELCNVPFSDAGKPMLQAARQDPKIMRDRLRRALLDFIAAECGAGPLLLVLDDLQWGDGLSVAALDEALREQADSALFLLSLCSGREVHQALPSLWTGNTWWSWRSRDSARRPVRSSSRRFWDARSPRKPWPAPWSKREATPSLENIFA